MTSETELSPKPLSIPEFAARIRRKYPSKYEEVDDRVLASRVAHKHPQYANRIDFGTTEQAEAEVKTAELSFYDAQNKLVSATGQKLNPDPAPRVKGPKLKANEEGIVSLAGDENSTVENPATRPRTVTQAPVALDPVIQSRLESVKRQRQQRETQQRVERARQNRAQSQQPTNSIYAAAQERARTGRTLAPNNTEVRSNLGLGRPINQVLSEQGVQKAQQRESIRPHIESQVRSELAQRKAKERAVPSGIISNERIWNPERLNTEADIQKEVDLRTREAIPEIAWRERNQPEIDRLTKEYRQAIRNSSALPGTSKWTVETVGKGASGVTEFMAGAVKAGGRLTGHLTGGAETTDQAADTIRIHAEALQKAAMEEGADRNQASQFASNVAGGLIGSAPEMGLMALGVPAPLAFAVGGGTRATGQGKPASGPALKGLATGAAFEMGAAGTGLTRLATKAGGVGLGTAGVELATGATPKEAAKAGATNALISLGFHAKEVPKAVLDYTVQSPLTPEPVRDALARIGKYDSWLYRAEDGRNMSIYRDPQTGAFGAVEIDKAQADKYDQAVNPGKVSKKVRQTTDVETDVYDDLARVLGVETTAPKKGLTSESVRERSVPPEPEATEVLRRNNVPETGSTAAPTTSETRAVNKEVRLPERPLPEPSAPAERILGEQLAPTKAESEVVQSDVQPTEPAATRRSPDESKQLVSPLVTAREGEAEVSPSLQEVTPRQKEIQGRMGRTVVEKLRNDLGDVESGDLRELAREMPLKDVGAEIGRATDSSNNPHYVSKFLNSSPLKDHVLAEIPKGSELYSSAYPDAPEMQFGAVRLRAPDGSIWEVDLAEAHSGDPAWKQIGSRLDGFAVRNTGEKVEPKVSTPSVREGENLSPEHLVDTLGSVSEAGETFAKVPFRFESNHEAVDAAYEQMRSEIGDSPVSRAHIEEVDPTNLISLQESVNRAGIIANLKHPSADRLPLIGRLDGNLYILDGNTYLTARYLRGGRVRANIIDLPFPQVEVVKGKQPNWLDLDPSERAKIQEQIEAPQVAPRPAEIDILGEGGAMATDPKTGVQTAKRVAAIKDGEITVTFERDPNEWHSGKISIDAHGPKGEYAGGVTFEDGGDGTVQATSLFVNKDWQRRGVASALYDMAEAQGYRPKPATGGRLSSDGSKFWDSRVKRKRPQLLGVADSVLKAQGYSKAQIKELRTNPNATPVPKSPEQKGVQSNVTASPKTSAGGAAETSGRGGLAASPPTKTQQITDWGARLKTIAKSKSLDDLKALSDEMAAHKDDPKVARLRTVIQAELARARQPQMSTTVDKPKSKVSAMADKATPKLSQKATKLRAEAERPEGKTIRPKPTRRIGVPKSNPAKNSASDEVRALGGIKDTADREYAGDLQRLKESGKRGIVNESGGMEAGAMAGALAQRGYFMPGVEQTAQGFTVTNVGEFLNSIYDDAAGSETYRSSEYDVIESDPDVKAWDALTESEYGKELIQRVESGNARAADILEFVREADANGLSEQGTQAFIDGLQRTVQEELHNRPAEEEGYSLDEDGTLLDLDGQPLFAREYQLGFITDELTGEEYHPPAGATREQIESAHRSHLEDALKAKLGDNYAPLVGLQEPEVDPSVRRVARELELGTKRLMREQKPLPDLTDALTALRKLNALRQSDTPVADFLNQMPLFGEKELSASQEKLLSAFDKDWRASVGKMVPPKHEDSQSSMFARGEGEGQGKPEFAVKGNRIKTNPAATKAFSDAVVALRREKPVTGGYLPRVFAFKVARELKSDHPELSEAIKQAATDHPFIRVESEEAERHEGLHELSRELSGQKEIDERLTPEGFRSVTSDAPEWDEIEEGLLRLGYQTTLQGMVEEGYATLADGKFEMLGITEAQAERWLARWFKAFIDAHGRETLDEFKERSDEADRAIQSIKDTSSVDAGGSETKIGKQGEDVRGMAEGRSSGDTSQTEGTGEGEFARDKKLDPVFAREDDPWSRLESLADDFERIANEPELAEGEKPRSLPKTLDMAGLESGPTKGYAADAHIAEAPDQGKQVVSEKGIDGAIEFVKSGDGIEWASTGYEVLAQLRTEQARLNAEGKTEEAGAIQEKKLKFLDDFALAAVERGRSIVGIKAIEQFSPDRMAYMLNKASLKKRKRGISPEEDARIAKLGEELGALEDRNKTLEKALEIAKASASKRAPKGKTSKTDYQSRLDEQAQTILQTLKPKVGKFDFAGLGRTSEKGALTIGVPPLKGDAELLAQYAASQLGKLNTVADLNEHLLSEFGQEIEPFLPKIRQRAYGIRQEARLAEIEAQETEPKRRKTILGEIQKEIAESLTAIREAQKAQDSALKAKNAAERKSVETEARLRADEAYEQQNEAKRQTIKEARADLKRLRQEMKSASKAETAGYRETIKAQKEAVRKAELWDTPLRSEAAEARERLKDATDPKDPQTTEDLVSVAAAKFLPDEIGGVPRKAGVEPARVYKDLKDEFPKLVTKKNQGEIYKRGYQRIQDMTAAAREAARLRSASAESKRLWNELGVDTDAQAVLIKQAEVRRQQDELRRKAVAEFNRVNKTLLERAWMEAQAIPRSMMSSIDAPLGRQGVYFLLTHPIEASKSAIPATLQGYGSIHVQDFVRAEQDLARHPDYDLALKSGLDLSTPSGSGDPALQAEEQFQSPLASKIFPHVRLSEQGYVLGMNAERLAMFSRLADVGRADGYTPKDNPEFFEEVANFVNDGTGRGHLPDAIKRASALTNFFFFSTRLNISRIQLLNDLFNPVKYLRDDPVMRKVRVGEVLRLAAALGTIYLLAKAMGIGTEFDPEDPDAFLLRIRNTRYDITGGEAGTIRFLYRFLASIYKTSTSEDLQQFERPEAIAGKFLRYKLAPFPSGVYDAVTHKDAVGQPANLLKFKSTKQVLQENIVAKRLMPILTGNFIDAVSEEGWIGLPMALPAVGGFGVSSYPDRGIRAIKNQKVVDELERLKITSQSLIGQKTKDDDLDSAIQKRILDRVEKLNIPAGATDIGKEKLIRDQLETMRALAKAETVVAEPAKYADYLKNKDGNESMSFLTDEEKAHLTEADLKKYRAKYADSYVEFTKKALSSEQYPKLSDDDKVKLLSRVGRIASTLAKRQMVEEKRKGTQ